MKTTNLIKEVERQSNEANKELLSIEISEYYLQEARSINFKYNDIFITINKKLKDNQIYCTFKD
jgi:hypothetical protein